MRVPGAFLFFLLPLFLSFFAPLSGAAAAASIATDELSRGVQLSLAKVEEFRFIREQAENMGVRVWLFGGTAAGFAHYVKWDILRKKGDTRYQPVRFDYDITNIYRSNQDLDLVMDGPLEKVQELERLVMKNHPYVQGNKPVWEVRLLRQKRGDKEPLLENPDFLNQHTDSNSTGMIEITTPHSKEWRIRDLRQWDKKDNYFLTDVAKGLIHFYFSPTHRTTSRFQAGMNPPLISVIRLLTKAFQFELKLRDSDLAVVKGVIDRFDPSEPQASYVRNWVERNAAKMVQNAVNVEYALGVLEGLGLKEKLVRLGDPSDEYTMAWWLNKQALPTKALGQRGQTARELGITVVAHETNSLLAYESITRAHTGEANVLTSRGGVAGEAALHGDGFYAMSGRTGGRGTGLTIRFGVDPEARAGEDFVVIGSALPFGSFERQMILFLNKKALRVIPEVLNLDPVRFFKVIVNDDALNSEDRGIYERYAKRLSHKFSQVSDWEYRKIAALMARYVASSNEFQINARILGYWFSLKLQRLQTKGELNKMEDYLSEFRQYRGFRGVKPDDISWFLRETLPLLRSLHPRSWELLEIVHHLEGERQQLDFMTLAAPLLTTLRDYLNLMTGLEDKEVMTEALASTWQNFMELKPSFMDLRRLAQKGLLSTGPQYKWFASLARTLSEYFDAMAAASSHGLLFLEATTDEFFALKPGYNDLLRLSTKVKKDDFGADQIIDSLVTRFLSGKHGFQEQIGLLGVMAKEKRQEAVAGLFEKARTRGEFVPLIRQAQEAGVRIVGPALAERILASLPRYFASKAADETLEALKELFPYHGAFRTRFDAMALALMRTVNEYHSLYQWHNHHSNGREDEFVGRTLDKLVSMSPRMSEFLLFMRHLYRDGDEDVLKTLPKVIKNADDFLLAVQFIRENPSYSDADDRQQTTLEFIKKHLALFSKLSPTQKQIDQMAAVSDLGTERLSSLVKSLSKRFPGRDLSPGRKVKYKEAPPPAIAGGRQLSSSVQGLIEWLPSLPQAVKDRDAVKRRFAEAFSDPKAPETAKLLGLLLKKRPHWYALAIEGILESRSWKKHPLKDQVLEAAIDLRNEEINGLIIDSFSSRDVIGCLDGERLSAADLVHLRHLLETGVYLHSEWLNYGLPKIKSAGRKEILQILDEAYRSDGGLSERIVYLESRLGPRPRFKGVDQPPAIDGSCTASMDLLGRQVSRQGG